MYNLTVKYIGAKSILLADTFFRLVIPGKDKKIKGLDVTIAQVRKIRPTHLEQFQEETMNNQDLKKLEDMITSGWPENISDVSEATKLYWCFCDEIVLDGLVLKGNRVVVPTAMCHKTLAPLHDGHQGTSATLRAGRTVYWPKCRMICAMLLKCTTCQTHAKKKPRVPE